MVPASPSSLCAAGAHALEIQPHKLNGVVFLVDAEGTPRATGFLVAVREGDIPVPYVVTARRCIEETVSQDFFVRINVEDRYDDIRTRDSDWYLHPDADVAVLPWAGGPSPHYNLSVETVENFVSADYDIPLDAVHMPGTTRIAVDVNTGKSHSRLPVELGQETCFIGLLAKQSGEERNLPIARFGNISRIRRSPSFSDAPVA